MASPRAQCRQSGAGSRAVLTACVARPWKSKASFSLFSLKTHLADQAWSQDKLSN